jgi:hypothetical protein
MKKAKALSTLCLVALLSTLLIAVVNADFTPSQAQTTWTFSYSQLNADAITFYFTPATSGYYKLSVDFSENAVFNATTTGGGFIDLFHDNGTGSLFSRMAFGVTDANLPYFWYDATVPLFEGSTYNGTIDGNPDFTYWFDGMERKLIYYDEAEESTVTTSNLGTITEVGNFSKATVNMVWLLTAGSVEFKLAPAVNATGVMDVLMVGVVLTVVFGSLGAIGYKKSQS